MNDPSLYSKNNSLQSTDVIWTLDNNLSLMKWVSGDKILDVGSGDGGVLFDILMPRLPPHFKQITYSDNNKHMLQYAENKYRNSPKVEFVFFDVGLKTIPQQFQQQFDHIFSFFCLHWVTDQKFQTSDAEFIRRLKPGGDMLFLLVANHLVFDVYEIMAESKKWAPYCGDLYRHRTPYQHSLDAAKIMSEYLKKVGFADYTCQVVERSFTFQNISVFWKFSSAVNPFLERIPYQELDDYKNHFIEEVKKHKKVKVFYDNEQEENICVSYKILVVFAKK